MLAHRFANELDAERFTRFLRTTAVSPNGHPHSRTRPLRDKGVLFILSTCRSLYNFGVRRRLLPPYFDNPFTEIGLHRIHVEDAKEIHVFTSDEAAAFLDACDDWQFPMFFVLTQTGMRPGELIHLLIEDIDLKRQMLCARCKAGLGWRVKTRRERRIPILPETAEVVRQVIGTRKAGTLFLRRRFWNCQSPPLHGDRG